MGIVGWARGNHGGRVALRFQWTRYARSLAVPLRTSAGDWYERQGILIRAEDDGGQVGFGEVAPIPEFGSEELGEAAAYLEGLAGEMPPPGAVPERLAATAFGLASAAWMIEEPETVASVETAYLLPTGELAREAMLEGAELGFRMFKLKIGVDDLNRELALIDALWTELPEGGRLRLDANGGLSDLQAREWYHCLEQMEAIEFLEQPLPRGQEQRMAELSQAHGVATALDESLVGSRSLDLLQAWPGKFVAVIKPGLLGDPRVLTGALAAWGGPVVVSSALETGVGMAGLLRVAQRLRSARIAGLGTLRYFADDLGLFPFAPRIDGAVANGETLERLWALASRLYSPS